MNNRIFHLDDIQAQLEDIFQCHPVLEEIKQYFYSLYTSKDTKLHSDELSFKRQIRIDLIQILGMHSFSFILEKNPNLGADIYQYAIFSYLKSNLTVNLDFNLIDLNANPFVSAFRNVTNSKAVLDIISKSNLEIIANWDQVTFNAFLMAGFNRLVEFSMPEQELTWLKKLNSCINELDSALFFKARSYLRSICQESIKNIVKDKSLSHISLTELGAATWIKHCVGIGILIEFEDLEKSHFEFFKLGFESEFIRKYQLYLEGDLKCPDDAPRLIAWILQHNGHVICDQLKIGNLLAYYCKTQRWFWVLYALDHGSVLPVPQTQILFDALMSLINLDQNIQIVKILEKMDLSTIQLIKDINGKTILHDLAQQVAEQDDEITKGKAKILVCLHQRLPASHFALADHDLNTPLIFVIQDRNPIVIHYLSTRMTANSDLKLTKLEYHGLLCHFIELLQLIKSVNAEYIDHNSHKINYGSKINYIIDKLDQISMVLFNADVARWLVDQEEFDLFSKMLDKSIPSESRHYKEAFNLLIKKLDHTQNQTLFHKLKKQKNFHPYLNSDQLLKIFEILVSSNDWMEIKVLITHANFRLQPIALCDLLPELLHRFKVQPELLQIILDLMGKIQSNKNEEMVSCQQFISALLGFLKLDLGSNQKAILLKILGDCMGAFYISEDQKISIMQQLVMSNEFGFLYSLMNYFNESKIFLIEKIAFLMKEIISAFSQKQNKKNEIEKCIKFLIQKVSKESEIRESQAGNLDVVTSISSYSNTDSNENTLEFQFYRQFSYENLLIISKLTDLPKSMTACLMHFINDNHAIVRLLKNNFSISNFALVQGRLINALSGGKIKINSDWVELAVLSLNASKKQIVFFENQVQPKWIYLILSLSILTYLSSDQKTDLFLDQNIQLLIFLWDKDFFSSQYVSEINEVSKNDLVNALKVYLNSHTELLLNAIEENSNSLVKLFCFLEIPADQIVKLKFTSPLDCAISHFSKSSEPLLQILKYCSFDHSDSRKLNQIGSLFLKKEDIWTLMICLDQNAYLSLEKMRTILIASIMKMLSNEIDLDVILDVYQVLQLKKQNQSGHVMFKIESGFLKKETISGFGEVPTYFALILKSIKNAILLRCSKSNIESLTGDQKEKIRNILSAKRGFFDSTESLMIYELLQNSQTRSSAIEKLNQAIAENEKLLKAFGYEKIVDMPAPSLTTMESQYLTNSSQYLEANAFGL